MSSVTNVILTFFELRDEPQTTRLMLDINAPGWTRGGRGFHHVGEHAGGTKEMEMDVCLGAFNYLDREGMLAHLRTIPWRDPQAVQVFICGQDDYSFTEVKLWE